MGFFIVLLFLITSLSSIGVSAIVGNDIKKIWWISILFVVIFLISYWLVLQEVIIDLIIYAVVYLISGIITKIISYKIGYVQLYD